VNGKGFTAPQAFGIPIVRLVGNDGGRSCVLAPPTVSAQVACADTALTVIGVLLRFVITTEAVNPPPGAVLSVGAMVSSVTAAEATGAGLEAGSATLEVASAGLESTRAKRATTPAQAIQVFGTRRSVGLDICDFIGSP
jgi:hypothetical protein